MLNCAWLCTLTPHKLFLCCIRKSLSSVGIKELSLYKDRWYCGSIILFCILCVCVVKFYSWYPKFTIINLKQKWCFQFLHGWCSGEYSSGRLSGWGFTSWGAIDIHMPFVGTCCAFLPKHKSCEPLPASWTTGRPSNRSICSTVCSSRWVQSLISQGSMTAVI